MVLLIVLSMILITACAGKPTPVYEVNTNSTSFMSKEFYPDYYAVKKLDVLDYHDLQRYTKSSNKSVVAASNLLLGKYIFINMDKTEGERLIRENYKSNELRGIMTTTGYLYLYDVFIFENKFEQAREIVGKLKSMKKDPYYNRAVSLYCTSEDLMEYYDRYQGDCYLRKLEAEYKIGNMAELQGYSYEKNNLPVPNATNFTGGNHSVYTSLREDSIIYLNEKDMSSDMVKGMIMAITDNHLKFKVTAKSNDPNRDYSDAVLAEPALNKLTVDKKDYIFLSDFEYSIYQGLNYVLAQSDYKYIILGTSNKYEGVTNQLAKNLKSGFPNITISIVNYESQDFQKIMNDYMKNTRLLKTAVIGIGSEYTLTNFALYVQYYNNNPKLTRAFYISDSFSQTYITNKTTSYFKDSVIITPNVLAKNDNYTVFNNKYNQYFGTNVKSEGLIGADMILFLNWYVHGGDPRYNPNLFFSVSGPDFNYSKNEISAFKVLNNSNIQKVEFKPAEQDTGVGGL